MKQLLNNSMILLFGIISLSVFGQVPQFEPTYQHDSLIMLDFAEAEEGYWLFEPAGPELETAPVVVFIHGYGGYNPMVYGAWIRHLVRQGNTVIYPRYQTNLFKPSPDEFAGNCAVAICDALNRLATEGHPTAGIEPLVLIGHSYGGVISADLATNAAKYTIPQPAGILLCSPGTGILSAGRLETYADLPATVKQITIATEDDYVVGDEFAELVHQTSGSEEKIYLWQYPFENDTIEVNASHNESYALDEALDGGLSSLTTKRALQMGHPNALDYFGYWALGDALIQSTRAAYDFTKILDGTDIPYRLHLAENVNIFDVMGSSFSAKQTATKEVEDMGSHR